MAQDAGLTIAWVLPRKSVDSGFARSNGASSPARMHPGYTCAVVLGSGGPAFWQRFRTSVPGPLRVEENPLDRYTISVVEALVSLLREHDPAAIAAYPFRHERQLVPFAGLLQGWERFRLPPFGVLIDPVHGPWFAWRAALLASLPLPLHLPEGEAPCVACPAPCVKACPAGAVDPAGFRWKDCVHYRLDEESCRERCLAREACPAGAGSRYPAEEIAYHYRASLRMIRESGLADHRGS